MPQMTTVRMMELHLGKSPKWSNCSAVTGSWNPFWSISSKLLLSHSLIISSDGKLSLCWTLLWTVLQNATFKNSELYISHLSLYSLIIVTSSDAMDNKSIQQTCLFLPGSTIYWFEHSEHSLLGRGMDLPFSSCHMLAPTVTSQGASQVALVVKNPPTNAGDIRGVGSIPGSGRSPEGGNGNPLQYSCLKNPMDKGAWRATVHRIAKSQTRLKWLSTHMCICCVYVLECMWVRVCTHNIFTLVYVYIMYTHVYYIYKCTYPF